MARRSPAGVIGGRLLQALPVILLATFMVFALLKLVPGDIAVTLAGDNAFPVDAVCAGGSRPGSVEGRDRAVAGADKAVNTAGRVLIKPGNLARRIDALGIGVCSIRRVETRVDGFG